MKALVGTSCESLDDYALTAVPTPERGRGQVRLRVDAAALGHYQIRPALPDVLGGEIAGTVDAVGAGVSAAAARPAFLSTRQGLN